MVDIDGLWKRFRLGPRRLPESFGSVEKALRWVPCKEHGKWPGEPCHLVGTTEPRLPAVCHARLMESEGIEW